MDLGSLLIGWCVKPSFIMVCLLGTVRCSNGDNNNCPCPEIPHINLTELPTRGCYNIGNAFRYKCIDGYLRKAGTSNLIRCQDHGGVAWTTPKLTCIPDPQRTTTPPPITTVPDSEWKTDDTEQTPTSSTTEPVNNGTDNRFSGSERTGPDIKKTVLICASAVIVCGLIGLGLWYYIRKRRTNNPPQTKYQTEEEMSPMKGGPHEDDKQLAP